MSQPKGTSSNPLGFNNARAIIVYDLSITDVKARQESIKKFDSVQDCAEFYNTGRHNIMRSIGGRWKCKRTGVFYAIRDCGTEPGKPGYGLLSDKAKTALLREHFA